MNVTLRQLQAFIAVAELGRFHLAADHLGLTQSAISILIRDLEAVLKHRLFDRHTRMVSLTTAGAEFLPQARKIMSDLEIAVTNVHELANLQRGRVTIAAAIVLAATLLPPVIARFVKRYPDIQVQVRDMPEEEIRSALKRNEADLGIGTVSADDPEIQASVLMRDQLTLICRSDHRFARAPQVSWANLAGEALIGLAKDNPLRGLVDHALIAFGVEVKTRYEVRFSTTAISMVAEGLGIAILPENSRQLTTNVDVRIVDLVDPVISRNISILQYRQPMLSPAAAKMKEFLMGASRKPS
ncbi:LysR family transcriptional regulator [Sinorhizobium medicae]|uniref:LysR family transcriptional regulator n=1 Tax=Sinorhizobium medicae TaxID=110321 RepID=UPI000FDBA159|nr:LysR family transcriptional regulator [Sinorhizobium medicae]MDX0599752.1 LysR family transcriptional regulator [Sinorhizobium medicae]MDX0816196.1 LysR family transcriptional regulator [Sinorhizobium medicae]MDX0859059.1 LysR family transcriptional regulator [Sinorhizobium medicae]RVJ25740.1 LysR family transcriptional regulator [Sinorhizobium medicae]